MNYGTVGEEINRVVKISCTPTFDRIISKLENAEMCRIIPFSSISVGVFVSGIRAQDGVYFGSGFEAGGSPVISQAYLNKGTASCLCYYLPERKSMLRPVSLGLLVKHN
jgi:hypothetical protein